MKHALMTAAMKSKSFFSLSFPFKLIAIVCSDRCSKSSRGIKANLVYFRISGVFISISFLLLSDPLAGLQLFEVKPLRADSWKLDLLGSNWGKPTSNMRNDLQRNSLRVSEWSGKEKGKKKSRRKTVYVIPHHVRKSIDKNISKAKNTFNS